MASYRIGIGSFNLKDGAVGIGTESTGLGNLKVEGTIKTTDLEQTIVSTNTIKDEQKGSVCVPMARFCEIVSALPNEEIKIKSNEDFLIEINSNQGTYKITGRVVLKGTTFWCSIKRFCSLSLSIEKFNFCC